MKSWLQEPGLLIDPDGEGVYLHADTGGGYRAAAVILHGTAAAWREIEAEIIYMRPGEDDHWRPVDPGRHPYGWKLNLPHCWRPVPYLYCTPSVAPASASRQPETRT